MALADKPLDPRAGLTADFDRQRQENAQTPLRSLGQAGLRPQPLSSLRREDQPTLPRVTQRGVITAFSNTCFRWGLAEPSHYILLGYRDNLFLGEQILYGRLAPPQDTRERASCILSISVGLGSIFNENASAEVHWLNTSKKRLGDKAPLPFMLEGRFMNLFKVLDEVERERGF